MHAAAHWALPFVRKVVNRININRFVRKLSSQRGADAFRGADLVARRDGCRCPVAAQPSTQPTAQPSLKSSAKSSAHFSHADFEANYRSHCKSYTHARSLCTLQSKLPFEWRACM